MSASSARGQAVPVSDWPALAALLRDFDRVVVECHPRLADRRALEFAELLEGRLELAMGLETAHAEALARLNKQMSLADFDRAAEFASQHGLGLRAFVLVGAPFVPPEYTVDWTVRSVEYAFQRAAGVVSLIPVRASNGEMERLEDLGMSRPPNLGQLEEALDRSMALDLGVVLADLWDLDRFARCRHCLRARRQRLERINRSGLAEPRAACPRCGAG